MNVATLQNCAGCNKGAIGEIGSKSLLVILSAAHSPVSGRLHLPLAFHQRGGDVPEQVLGILAHIGETA